MALNKKFSFDLKRLLPASAEQVTITSIVAGRAVAAVLVVSLLLPLPWFSLSDGGESVAGTRLLSLALDGFSLPYLLSVSPLLALLFFSLPFLIAVLSLMTLADAIINKGINVRRISALNVIAMLALMYAATVAADPTKHVVSGGYFVLPKWGLWITLSMGVVLASLPSSEKSLNLGRLLAKLKR